MAKKKTADTTVDRRTTDRRQGDRRTTNQPVAKERRTDTRRKVQRRRQIDPTTCERDYNNDEIEFMHALDEYKRANGRMFPTCSEILEVIRALGYQKVSQVEVVEASVDANSEGGEGELEETTESLEAESLEAESLEAESLEIVE